MLARNQPFGQAFAFDALEAVVPVAQDDLERLAPVVGRQGDRPWIGRPLAATVVRVSANATSTRFASSISIFRAAWRRRRAPSWDVTVHGPLVGDTFLLPEAAEQAGGHVWRVVDGRLSRQDLSILGAHARRPPGAGRSIRETAW